MHQSRPCLRLLSPHLVVLLSLMLLAGLVGCGPASSDNAPNLESRASVGGPDLVAAAQGTGQGGKTPVQEGGVGSASGKGTIPGGDKSPSKSAGAANNIETGEDKKIKAIEAKKSEALPVPHEIARDFESPYARIRLQALDYWATQGNKAPLDPLLEALEDEDEDVRAKAAKIAEQHWGIKQELD